MALVYVVLEIYVMIQVGHLVGAGWTVLLLIATAVLGGWLVKHEGARAWSALRDAITAGRMPTRELADNALVLVGGAMMISPGFISDVVGAFLILPFTRPLARRVLIAVAASRLVVIGPGDSHPGNGTRPGAGPQGPVVQGEVVDD